MDEQFMDMPMSDIHVDEEFNCRKKIAPIDVVDLAKDITKNGLLQPVIIAQQSEEQIAANGRNYRLIAGFRRYKAHIVNKSETILCSIHPGGIISELEARYLNLSENLNREDLNIVQEAGALKEIFQAGATESTAMRRLSKSRGWIQVRFMLLKLPDEVQVEVAAGFINQTQIRELYKLYNRGTTDELHAAIKKIKNAKMRGEKSPVIHAPNHKRAYVKKHRKRNEIFEMMAHIAESIGNGFGTRCLSWAAGEITDGDIISDIEELALDKGISYHRPEWA